MGGNKGVPASLNLQPSHGHSTCSAYSLPVRVRLSKAQQMKSCASYQFCRSPLIQAKQQWTEVSIHWHDTADTFTFSSKDAQQRYGGTTNQYGFTHIELPEAICSRM